MRTNDAVSGALLIAAAVAMIALTAGFPPMPGQKYGPALFPRLLGAGIILCGVLLVIRGLAARASDRRLFMRPGWMSEGWRLGSVVLVFAVIFLSYQLYDRVGFVPVTLVSLSVMFIWFGVARGKALLFALIATVAVQLFFGRIMRVPLPLGWLLNLPPEWHRYIT